MTTLLTTIVSPFKSETLHADAREMSACAKLARMHGVEMLYYAQLRKHYQGASAAVDDYLRETENLHRENAIRSMKQEGAERKIVAALEKASIPACILKGNEIARLLYDDPNCRTSADIDLLIKTHDIGKADKILSDHDYHRDNPLPLAFWVGRLHHASYRDNRHHHMLELHWDFGIPGYFNLSSEDIWKDAIKKTTAGYALAPDMMMLQLFIHHFRHAFREFKILVDILWGFYRYDDVISWPDFAYVLKKAGLIKSAKITLTQLDDLWRLNEGPLESFRIVKRHLDSYPVRPSGLIMRYFAMDPQREHRPDHPRDIAMAKLALDGKAAILYSFTKFIFPRPRDIRALYGGSGKWMLPIHYVRYMFWRVSQWIARKTV